MGSRMLLGGRSITSASGLLKPSAAAQQQDQGQQCQQQWHQQQLGNAAHTHTQLGGLHSTACFWGDLVGGCVKQPWAANSPQGYR